MTPSSKNTSIAQVVAKNTDVGKNKPITSKEETKKESERKASDEPSSGCININEASYEQLQEIIHIGPARAEELINLRPFASIDEPCPHTCDFSRE